ncbi:hypothetical protein F511_38490 [Dorcoceras hygrometricum]|uniref:Fringe-related family protein n=1 Tax=Dorcoceras hygrometricum TaxID=472368 RepID=A0A2Z7CWW4_9LAMI|nr:hypothetical protein F511_38490 [Dorcoceras hygrometricum]
MISPFSSEKFAVSNLCKVLLILGLALYFISIFVSNENPNCPSSDFLSYFKRKLVKVKDFSPPPVFNNVSCHKTFNESATDLNHIVFGLLGSENAWHWRRPYIESWWRPNVTRGLMFLDKYPTGELLPWSEASPPFKVSDDLTTFLDETKARAPIMIRMVHGIMEVLREVEKLGDHEQIRWLVMGDDDSIFFVDNLVDVLGEYDHKRYYYLGGQSEFVLSNYWFQFNQAFGGAGIILSYPLAKALAKDMDSCLRRYAHLSSADLITMACVGDIGVNLSPNKGIHQIDLRGDLSGFLSSHPKFPLLSLHHFDHVNPIFPSKDRSESTRHLMKAADADQSRLLQQTICYDRKNKWTFSISWGYSAHIYEKIMTRSYIQNPIETFQPWSGGHRPPLYMFNTRLPSNDPCEAPHGFFLQEVNKSSSGTLTVYSRAAPRGMGPCKLAGNQSAEFISEIHVLSPATKRPQVGFDRILLLIKYKVYIEIYLAFAILEYQGRSHM